MSGSLRKVKGQIFLLVGCFLSTGCENNTYGMDCSKKCSEGCVNGSCDVKDGTCLHGCLDGYNGNKCFGIQI